MKPKIPLLDKRFKYVPSSQQDVAKTFRRVRERMKEEAIQQENIVRIFRKK